MKTYPFLDYFHLPLTSRRVNAGHGEFLVYLEEILSAQHSLVGLVVKRQKFAALITDTHS
jgi:hypothetical protein